MRTDDDLLQLIRSTAAQPAAPVVRLLSEAVCRRYGEAVQAVMFYGSCLRSGDDRGGMVDLYVIVDRYRTAYRSWGMSLLNAVLPPNVFYLEVAAEERVVRAKYAVVSMADLERGTSARWFHSYLWGRFAQPTAVLYARTPEVAERVHAALAQAVVTFLSRVIPCMPNPFDARDLWLNGLTLSYRAELRAERPAKLAGLYQASPHHYNRVTAAALPLLPFRVASIGGDPPRFDARLAGARRAACRIAWRLRSVQGKLLHLLRLLKGAFTFSGGLDYILWKIERHTGVSVEVPPRLRAHPILAVCVLSWRLYRRGAFR
jgi:hypothetical protein